MNNNDLVLLQSCLETIYALAENNGINSILYNEQFVEVIMAGLLGHKYNKAVRGFDAFDSEGAPVEYKSINLATKATGSFQFHWLSKNKLEEYSKVKNVFFSLRFNSDIKEIWKLPMEKILPELETKCIRAEEDRLILFSNGRKKKINTDGHKSFSLDKLIELGAVLVYSKDVEDTEVNINAT